MGFSGADSVNGGAGADSILLSASSTDLNNATDAQITNIEAVSASSATTGVTIDLRNQSEGFTITGSGLDDVITGGAGVDKITAGNGADTIIGFVGADSIDGGAGQDTIALAGTSAGLNAASNSQIANVEAVSAVSANAGVTIDLHKQTEGFAITGSSFADSMIGGAGADVIVGGAGNDSITGGGGLDFLTGGQGTDTFIFKALADSTPGASPDNH